MKITIVNLSKQTIDLVVVDKLGANTDNEITFYIDERIQNEFMAKVVHDVQSLTETPVKTTGSQVCVKLATSTEHDILMFQDWRDFDYVVFCNVDVFPSESDQEFADTINTLFQYDISFFNCVAVRLFIATLVELVVGQWLLQPHENFFLSGIAICFCLDFLSIL